MEELTKLVLEDCKELMDLAMNESKIDVTEMSVEEFKAIQIMMRMYKNAEALALKQAKMMDDINKKLDVLLEK